MPIPHTALIGRESESKRLTALLDQPEGRLVTLTGPGGCGKTRLAVEVASRLADRFDDGIAFVALDDVRDPAEVPMRIDRQLGLPDVDDDGGTEILADFLRDRRMLIVLDNFEHVVDAAHVIGLVASRCRRAMWLATSRRPLHLRGEQVVELRPLAVPDDDATGPDVAAAPAVALFCERAAAVDPDFSPSSATLSSIATICRLVDGLPLAIELAAARVRVLPPAALLTKLTSAARPVHGALLSHGAIDAAAHHRGLGDTIRWSYDLLTPPARELLRRVAVFEAGWTLDSLEAVLADIAEDSLLEALAELVDLHLVEPVAAADGDQRYRLLETVRRFALDLLDEAGERAAVELRHAEAFVAFALAAGAGLESRQEPVWVRRVEAELPNLWATFDWLAAAGRVTDGLRAATALGPFWLDRGPTRSGRRQLERFLAIAADDPTAVPDEVVATAIGWSARLGLEYGDIATTRATGEDPVVRLQRAAAITDAAGDRLAWLRIMVHLASAHRLRGEDDSLDRCLARALERAHTPDTRWLRAELLDLVSATARERGDRDRALDLARECVDVAKLAGNERVRLRTMFTIIILGTGDERMMRQQLEEVFGAQVDLGDRRGAAGTAATIGAILTVSAEPALLPSAAEWFRRTIELGRSAWYLHAVAFGTMGLVGVAHRTGRAEAAARLHGALMTHLDVLRREIPPDLFALYEAEVATLRARLGESEFPAHCEIGAALTWKAGIDEALAIADECRAGEDRAPSATGRRRGPRANPELTDREREVLAELVHGHTNQGIAEALGVSPKTVMHHTVNVYRKLAVRGRAEAIAHALRTGLVTT